MDRRALLLAPALVAPLALAGCAVGPPAGLAPVRFEAERYLGTWFEIARLDQSFQRGLEQVTATYARNPDGTIRVVNRAVRTTTGEPREATARGRFLQGPEVASLAVSFFPPFEGGYHVIRLAPDYSIALVTGNDRSFLWLLSRTPTLPEPVVQDWLAFARAQGFAVDEMIRTRPAPMAPAA